VGPPTYLAPPTVAGKSALCNARPMPRPRREPRPDDRQATLPLAKAPARRATPTPEAIAKMVTDRDPSPVGQPDLAAIALRLALPRAVLEQLRARAIRESRKLEALIQEILEGAAADQVTSPRRGRESR
jgi:hypothetical protein